MENELSSFKAKLNESYQWPASYIFKFVCKVENKQKLFQLFDQLNNLKSLKERPSKKGNYISITGEAVVENADEVISVYKNAGEIEGIISL